METKDIIATICQSVLRKKGTDLKILDVRGLTSIADYFVLVSVRNRKQAQAAADETEDQLKLKDLRPLRREGYREGGWVLLDYGDIVVHVFTDEERQRYELDTLWSDAREETYDEATGTIS